MKTRQAFLASLALLIIPTAAMAIPPSSMGYAYAQISQANTTVTLVNVTLDVESGAALTAIKCIFPSDAGSAKVKVEITSNPGPFEKDFSFTADSTFFERESNGAGRFLSAWVPVNVGFNHGLLVQLNNTGLGTATINCWAAYAVGHELE